MLVSVAELKESLNFSDDLGTSDDALMGRIISAAQSLIERKLGYEIEATYGGADQQPVPPALVQAVSLLACDWYENREANLVGIAAQELPFGVATIVREFRRWSFG